MQFGLSESQNILKSNARKFFAAECPMAEVRRLAGTPTAYDAALWAKMAEQGFTGIVFPEEHGGLGLGKVELALLMEEMGRALLPGPYFSTLAAAVVVDACGSEEQKARFLAPVSAGRARATIAITEKSVHAPMVERNGTLTGEKLFVADAAVADYIVVIGKSSAHVVEAGAAGLGIQPLQGLDITRKIYALKFDAAPAIALTHPEGVNRALEVAAMALAAEMVGGMQRVLDLAVEYAKTRKQFGKPIGQFQAVQHQLADSYLETESARSAAYYAAWTLEQGTPDVSTAVSIAKMYASDAARNVGNRGIQVHGGMGFTWENDVHLYYRRFKADETALGDATYHRERIARLVIDTQVGQAVAPAF